MLLPKAKIRVRLYLPDLLVALVLQVVYLVPAWLASMHLKLLAWRRKK
jgi:hypothetical protein